MNTPINGLTAINRIFNLCKRTSTYLKHIDSSMTELPASVCSKLRSCCKTMLLPWTFCSVLNDDKLVRKWDEKEHTADELLIASGKRWSAL